MIDEKLVKDDTPIFDELWAELIARAHEKHDEYYVLGNMAHRLDSGLTEGMIF